MMVKREKRYGSWALIRIQFLTGDLLKWTGCFWAPMFRFPRRTDLMQGFFGSGNSKRRSWAVPAILLEEARINLDEETQRTRLHKLSEVIHLVEAKRTTLPQGTSLLEKDVPILHAAIEAQATHLLTGDIVTSARTLIRGLQGVASCYLANICASTTCVHEIKQVIKDLRLKPHRCLDTCFLRELLGFVVAGVDVTDYAHARICCKHALDALCHLIGSVGDGDLSGVQRVADADAAAIVN
jgi:hypothetical protein